jgi:ParB/RepB/Spo0J family partition protein
VKNLTKQQSIGLNPEISSWRTNQSEDPKLTKSLKEKGQLHNMVARRLPDGKIDVFIGSRRYRHLLKLGVKPEDMKIDVREGVSDLDAALMAFAENNERKDMTAIEEGRAFRTMNKLGMPIQMIAVKNNLSDNYVRERLDLLKLPAKIQERMENGEIDLGYGKVINRLSQYGEHAQIELAKAIIAGKAGYYGGIRSLDDANDWVDNYINKIKYMQHLAEKYGPCPQCGCKEITGDRYPEDMLICTKCGYRWNRNTKEPYALTELRKDAEKLGLKIQVGDGTAVITPQDIGATIQRVNREMETKNREGKRQTLRSVHTLAEILAPLITPENINIIRVEGETIEIRLIQESQMHFSARRHNYDSGEKSRINLLHIYNEEPAINIARVEQYLKTLKFPEN